MYDDAEFVELLGGNVMNMIEEGVAKFFGDLKAGCNNLASCEDVYKAIGAGRDLFILDIRKAEDFDKEHIENAVNVSWAQVGDHLEDLPRDKKIVVVCYTGQTAGQTVALLKLMGYDACSLKGGMNNGWKKGDMPIAATCMS